MTRPLAGLAMLLLAACGGSDPSAPSGDALPAADVTGTWTATLANPVCAGGTPVTFLVIGTDDDVQPFGSLTFTSTWSAGAATGTLYGTFNLRTRVVSLRFFPTVESGQAAAFDGALDDTLALAGDWTDPYATLAPLFGAGACTTTATAARTAPAG